MRTNSAVTSLMVKHHKDNKFFWGVILLLTLPTHLGSWYFIGMTTLLSLEVSEPAIVITTMAAVLSLAVLTAGLTLWLIKLYGQKRIEQYLLELKTSERLFE